MREKRIEVKNEGFVIRIQTTSSSISKIHLFRESRVASILRSVSQSPLPCCWKQATKYHQGIFLLHYGTYWLSFSLLNRTVDWLAKRPQPLASEDRPLEGAKPIGHRPSHTREIGRQRPGDLVEAIDARRSVCTNCEHTTTERSKATVKELSTRSNTGLASARSMKKTTMEIRSWPNSQRRRPGPAALRNVCAACDGAESRRRTTYRAGTRPQ